MSENCTEYPCRSVNHFGKDGQPAKEPFTVDYLQETDNLPPEIPRQTGQGEKKMLQIEKRKLPPLFFL